MRFYRRYNHPTSNLWSVMNDFNRISRQMDRAFGRRAVLGHRVGTGAFPHFTVSESDDAYTLRAALPGMTAADLDLEATAKGFTISGERKAGVEEGGRYLRRERKSGKFSRTLEMPVEINPEGVDACMKNGVLVLTLPKAEAVKPRRITVN